MGHFKAFDHTADVGLSVTADSLDDFFVTAAQGLGGLLCDSRITDVPVQDRKISLRAGCLEDLLIAWLNELISLFFAYQLLPVQYSLRVSAAMDNYSLDGIIKFSTVSRDAVKQEIKAATYCGLKVKKRLGRYSAKIVFDV